MFNQLIRFDKWLFSIINQKATNAFFDTLMPIIRQPLNWIPLYLFLIIYAFIKFPKKALYWILGLGITATITDVLSSHIIKPFVGRLRPCNDLSIASSVRLLVDHCGQNGSFTSSHATNHFGVAMFIFMTLSTYFKNYRYLFFVWAGAISYAQVYVGVHFPFDVLFGGILGCIIGWGTGELFTQKFNRIDKFQ